MNSFKTQSTLTIEGQDFEIFDLNLLSHPSVATLPFSFKILLENLLRNEDGISVQQEQIQALLNWDPSVPSQQEICFTPARVLLQDFTGVPCIVDLASMRDAMVKIGGDPQKINPLNPVELVVDHSVMVDYYGNPLAINMNVDKDYERNAERYALFKWGQKSFKNFRVVPPNTGIVHQVNLEYLARVVFANKNSSGDFTLYPDTIVGTDSHTTMVNGLGVLGWGVGGIEAEAAMLGQAITMLIPDVVGVRLSNELPVGVTATDLVLTLTHLLRKHGVVGKFVEFFGPGLKNLTLADRATISNMSPEFGATCAIFPYDDETLRYLELTGRSKEHIHLTKAYAQHQGLFYKHDAPQARYSVVLEFDLASILPCIAGPKRPQDKIVLTKTKDAFRQSMDEWIAAGKAQEGGAQELLLDGKKLTMKHGSIVIAAITSCTNTSNPAVLIAAGLLAKAAVERGLTVPGWVKTSLAPGSQVVTSYLNETGLMDFLETLGFYTVGYGCTTCIGNSGPLRPEISQAIAEANLTTCAVLSGNRNFEGRIHPEVRNAYLASPPLVVAYALAGTMDIDFDHDPLGYDRSGQPVFLRDIWPSSQAVGDLTQRALSQHQFKSTYQNVFKGDQRWNAIDIGSSPLFPWNAGSTYIKNPPYFENFTLIPQPIKPIRKAKVFAIFGDSITTDHISPAGDIAQQSPAGSYLKERGIEKSDFNSYGSRRGNHEVMMRGTFANIRLKNKLAQGKDGGYTIHWPSQQLMTMYEASVAYQQEKTDLIILAGKEYGSGSSRDWAAKGTRLLGVRAVIAESFERIHRSNLVGMGVLPLQFLPGQTAETLGLIGSESLSINIQQLSPKQVIDIIIEKDGQERTFQVLLRVDTPKEIEYIQNDGILPYVVRELFKKK